MLRHGPALEREQLLLGRFVDIGTELFAMIVTCARAQSLLGCRNAEERAEVLQLAGLFCRMARLRIEHRFHALRHNADHEGYRVANTTLDGRFSWLEEGSMGHMPDWP